MWLGVFPDPLALTYITAFLLLSLEVTGVTGLTLGFSELALLEALGSILPLTGVLRITELKNIELGVELKVASFQKV